jgi:hypothetical protein
MAESRMPGHDSGILRITRTSQFANRWRRIHVHVDGQRIGDVGNGETVDFMVGVGDHDVHAEIDGCHSQTVHVQCAAGAATTLRLGSPLTGWRLWRTQQALAGPPGSFIALDRGQG